MSKNEKIIPITCTGTEFIEISSLTPLQGSLKTRTPEQLTKLKNQILKHGFSFPIFIWKDKGVNYTMDGHGRDIVCKELLGEGYLFSKGKAKPATSVPCDFIEARNKIEAKEKLLGLNSQFGHMTQEGLQGYINELGAELNFESISMNLELECFSNTNKIGNKSHEEFQDIKLLDVEKYPITIIVTKEDYELWCKVKGNLKIENDRNAFINIIEEL